MKVAIIGTGKMGRGFAQALAPKHEVIVGSRDLESPLGAVRASIVNEHKDRDG
jgi:predicted dinucleotide-binding enzyme